MDCKQCRVEIDEVQRGAAVSEAAAAHIQACAGCTSFRNESLALGRLIGDLEMVTAPADFDFRLRARLANLKSEQPRGFAWPRFAPDARSIALAASFAVLVAAGFVGQQVWSSSGTASNYQAIHSASAFEFAAINSVPVNATVIPSAPSEVTTALSYVPKPVRNESVGAGRRASASDGIENRDSALLITRPQVTPLGIPDPLSIPPSMVSVPMQVNLTPATVLVNSKQSGQQNISVRPVTFGAQNVFEQKGSADIFFTPVQGVW